MVAVILRGLGNLILYNSLGGGFESNSGDSPIIRQFHYDDTDSR